MGCLTFFFSYCVWYVVLVSHFSPKPVITDSPSTISKVDLTAEERKESREMPLGWAGEMKWAFNKAGFFAFPLSLISTHLIYRYGKKIEGFTNRVG